jgi:GNAT superfamily N-acetyltransferase
VRPNPLELATVSLADLDSAATTSIVELCSDALQVDCGPLFGYLSSSTHLMATREGQLVGHACWTVRQLVPERTRPLRTAWVDAVVVAPAEQGQGIGTAVMRSLADRTSDFELRALGTERLGFFAGLGWERWLGPCPGVLHDAADSLMVLRTALSPRLDPAARISVE